MSNTVLSTVVQEEDAGMRLDQLVARTFPDWSRARLQQWIKSGAISVNGESRRCKDKVGSGDEIVLIAQMEDEVEGFLPEEMALDVIYEDDAIVVLNKPAGLVVHPAPGNWQGTLLNGLLHRYPDNRSIPRAGIVHRLDKNTSGMMVVARTLEAHKLLVDALQQREIRREYLAIVEGVPIAGGVVDAAIGRHSVDRKRMAVRESGKEAITHYRVKEKFTAHALLDVKLETGRTHQIRVHLAHIHFPIVGDSVYGGRRKIPKGVSEQIKLAVKNFPYQALHARKLVLINPGSGEEMTFEAEPPEIFQQLLKVLGESV